MSVFILGENVNEGSLTSTVRQVRPDEDGQNHELAFAVTPYLYHDRYFVSYLHRSSNLPARAFASLLHV